MNLRLGIGQWLFKHRSFTPLPLILIVFLFFRPQPVGSFPVIWDVAGLFLIMLGEAIRVIAVGYTPPGTSGRENYLRADSLNREGIYSLTRNPLYIGNFLIFSGGLLVYHNPVAQLLFSLFLIGQYYLIILTEEEFLIRRYGDLFLQYQETVPRILPIFSRYRSPACPFSWKKVILKENDSVFNALMLLLIIGLYREMFQKNRSWSDLKIYFFLILGLILVYLSIKIIKRKGFKK